MENTEQSRQEKAKECTNIINNNLVFDTNGYIHPRCIERYRFTDKLVDKLFNKNREAG